MNDLYFIMMLIRERLKLWASESADPLILIIFPGNASISTVCAAFMCASFISNITLHRAVWTCGTFVSG